MIKNFQNKMNKRPLPRNVCVVIQYNFSQKHAFLSQQCCSFLCACYFCNLIHLPALNGGREK